MQHSPHSFSMKSAWERGSRPTAGVPAPLGAGIKIRINGK